MAARRNGGTAERSGSGTVGAPPPVGARALAVWCWTMARLMIDRPMFDYPIAGAPRPAVKLRQHRRLRTPIRRAIIRLIAQLLPR